MAEDRQLGQPELPPGGEEQPQGPGVPGLAVRWTGGEILAAVFVGLLWPGLLFEGLRRAGFYAWFYGANFPGVAPDSAATPTDLLRLRLWAVCAALPLQVGSVLVVLRAFSGTRPEEVGLTARRLGGNLLRGLAAAGVLVPVVYGIQFLVVLLYRRLGVDVLQQHPFTDLGKKSLYPLEWVLLVAAATVVAGLWEELLFRGLIQPWVIARAYGGRVALGVALFMALVTRSEGLRAALERRSAGALLPEMAPALVLLGLVPIYVLLEQRDRVVAGLFASSVLFAWVHSSVWPSPVPLLVLALGLGWLALRTGSLAGPILLHALFNAVACLILLWALVGGA
jgi:membrane protease YdiL (CAAX protease family)